MKKNYLENNQIIHLLNKKYKYINILHYFMQLSIKYLIYLEIRKKIWMNSYLQYYNFV